ERVRGRLRCGAEAQDTRRQECRVIAVRDGEHRERPEHPPCGTHPLHFYYIDLVLRALLPLVLVSCSSVLIDTSRPDADVTDASVEDAGVPPLDPKLFD